MEFLTHRKLDIPKRLAASFRNCREEAALRAPIHPLEVNHRSSRSVCDTADAVLKLENARFGSVDRESTALMRAASVSSGKIAG